MHPKKYGDAARTMNAHTARCKNIRRIAQAREYAPFGGNVPPGILGQVLLARSGFRRYEHPKKVAEAGWPREPFPALPNQWALAWPFAEREDAGRYQSTHSAPFGIKDLSCRTGPGACLVIGTGAAGTGTPGR
jgi:hypothetical protein